MYVKGMVYLPGSFYPEDILYSQCQYLHRYVPVAPANDADTCSLGHFARERFDTEVGVLTLTHPAYFR